LDTDVWHRLALLRLPDTGAATLLRLFDHYPDPAALLDEPAERWLELGLSAAAREALAQWRRLRAGSELARAADRDLERLRAIGATVLWPGAPAYPARLRDIDTPPPLLFVLGPVARLEEPMLAMVGSRRATAAGLDIAAALAADLVRAGLGVCSGLALGIDAAAHRGALAAGGLTVAVSGVGIDRVYPWRHRALQQQLLDAGGVLVSEFPPGVPALKHHFPRRNRLVSGLSLGVLVVEAAQRSGSLVTARLALEQGREVFAVPGSVRNPQSAGCLQLLRDGAVLTRGADDVLEELFGVSRLAPQPTPGYAPVPAGLDPAARQVLEALGDDPVDLDGLLRRTGLPAPALQQALTALEIAGLLACAAGCYQRR
jgi:DNA processing protein